MHTHQDSKEDHTNRIRDERVLSAVGTIVPEILAPAGGRPQFFAALNSGADAVFLGLQSFNARARATNFSPEDLRQLVPIAHAHGMKVLVTVNILVKQSELGQLFETLEAIEAAGADAVIVQDLAVARIVKNYFPNLRLHASTQMAVHNLAGVLEAARFGFKRIVLARELTHPEIKKIRQAVPRETAELEAFCHGSLCYSYSGLCFFSGAEDARSGNRGECSYTCRQPYKIVSEPGHGFLFSMRDLDTSPSLELLVNAGIDTLKIEGRKKDAQYVATSVKLYRKSLNRIFGRDTLRSEAPQAARDYIGNDIPVELDQEFTFRRKPTTFFLKSRYQENVIDLDNPTHKGLLVGSVLSSEPGKVTFKSEHELELYDGLRISDAGEVFHSKPQHGESIRNDLESSVARYENQHTEFSLRGIQVRGGSRTSAKAGEVVTVQLPDPRLTIAKGALVHKVRSADLKARIERLTQLPPDTRLSDFDLIDLNLTVTPLDTDGVAIESQSKHGSLQFSNEIILLAEAERPKNPSRFVTDLQTALAVIGDEKLAADTVTITGDTDWFVPKSVLKKFKARLGRSIRTGLDEERLKRSLRWRDSEQTSPILVLRTDTKEELIIKTDRLETAISALSSTASNGMLTEIIFEPKRAFAGSQDLTAQISELLVECQNKGVILRIALPTVVRAWDEPLLGRWITHAFGIGIKHYEIGNLGGKELLRRWTGEGELDISGDFTLYALNIQARNAYKEIGIHQLSLSIEDDLENITAHAQELSTSDRLATTAILYKDTPLFIAEACSLTALHNGCPTAAVCGYRTLEIENKEGERFFVAHEACKSVVYGKSAYSITQFKSALQGLGFRRFRLDFLTRPYDRDAIDTIIAAGFSGTLISGTHPANFSRNLL